MVHVVLVLFLAAAPRPSANARSNASAASQPAASPASTLLAIPDLDASRIVDRTATFTVDDRQRLSELARKLSVDAPDQALEFAVLLVPTTRGEPIDAFTRRVAAKWRVGSPDVPNTGILLVAAKDDHTMRVEVGAGLEKVLDQGVRRFALDNAMMPAFRKGAFAGGFASGIQLIRRAYVERTAMPAVPGPQTGAADVQPALPSQLEAPAPAGHDVGYYLVCFLLVGVGGTVIALFFFASRDRSGYGNGGGDGSSDSSWTSRDDVFTSSISSSFDSSSSSSSSSDSFSSSSSSDFSGSSGGSSDDNGSSGSW